ncbi:zinc-dependent metalloprotease family protein [Mesorhizobium sp.]|uniref:zinc-dependent metalloprotease family protein n=1 Tax=Mesorhizobium sp. TaxID=1871066 RepID=UPI00257FB277|nr:zinc-dependent metalloprotease family protein [Mesorhizobium sp.]
MARLHASSLYESVKPVELNAAALLKPHFTFSAESIFGSGEGTSDTSINSLQEFVMPNASVDASGLPTDFEVISPAEEPTSVVISVHSGMITGAITTQDAVYSIRPLGNGVHVVMKRGIDSFPEDHIKSDPTGVGGDEGAAGEQQRFEQLEEKRNTLDLSDTPVVSVLVGFTKEASEIILDPRAFAEASIEIFNNALKTSQVDVKFALAAISISSQPQTVGIIALERSLLESNDGYYDGIRSEADASNADITVVIFARNPDNDPCGKATEILPKPDKAIAVVAEDCAIDRLTFFHEIGHLFGLRHDIDLKEKPYKYGHGYTPDGANWQTIMAQSCKLCGRTRKPLFSNPDLTFEGITAGNTDWSNESEVFRQMAPVIAIYR